MFNSLRTALLVALIASGRCSLVVADDVLVGPQTEERFPPLVVPEGFRATLFACDPLVEYPSVIALGPRPDTLFVAHDYVTGLGEEIIRRDEIRVLADTDGDGYADQSTVFAEGFNSIQGLAYDGEYVYAMHAPYLTRVRDADGDGVAEERTDLLDGLGLPPEENPNRLHCANGVTVGHDGWLYLALGDRGCDTQRPEGDRLVFQQGGILRCRPDGTDLHVFSSGLRNIYDVAIDDELNVFVRDNENDGGDYMIRVCHCFFGSDHGYPYHYIERPDEAMPPLADLGRGSSAGVTTYLETAFPPEYRNSLYACEWGRAVVRYPLVESGSGFAPTEEIDFASGAAEDPYGFHPTDLVVDYDGALLISDWCDGQRPKRGRGRIYRIESAAAPSNVDSTDVSELSNAELFSYLDSPSYHARVSAQREIQQRGADAIEKLKTVWGEGQFNSHARLHVIWIIALSGESAVDGLLDVIRSDDDPRVIAQAMRAIGDLSDPVILEDRLDVAAGDQQLAEVLSNLAYDHPEPCVLLDAASVLGRLQYRGAPLWLYGAFNSGEVDVRDPALRHAAVRLLRRSRHWVAMLQQLDAPPGWSKITDRVRELELLALAEQANAEVVDGLIERLAAEPLPERRIEYIDLLSRIARLPAEWTYWGFRPGPRPVNTVEWERTEAIEAACINSLADPDLEVRAFALQRMIREDLRYSASSLAAWLDEDTDPDRAAAILDALAARPFDETLPLLEACLCNRLHADANRLTALKQLTLGVDASSERLLLTIADSIEDGPVLAALFSELGERPALDADGLLLGKLDSTEPAVRAAAIDALTMRMSADLSEHLGRLLDDASGQVVREAVEACGVFEQSQHADRILSLAGGNDAGLQLAGLVTLKKLNDARAVPIATAGLESEITQLASLEYLEQFGDLSHLAAVEGAVRGSFDSTVQIAGIRAIAAWSNSATAADYRMLREAIARIQGRSGNLSHWYVAGPMSGSQADAALAEPAATPPSVDEIFVDSRPLIADGAEGRIELAASAMPAQSVWLASADVYVTEACDVEFLGGSLGTLAVWLNGTQVYEREEPSAFRLNGDVFGSHLESGANRILVRIDSGGEASQFHMSFRRRSSKAEHEQLMQFVLTGTGDVARGREVFLNAEKSQCARCHRLDPTGPRIGPDLTGVGSRFSRVHILESILEPSRTIAPSYATVAVALNDGQIITGINVSEQGAGSEEPGVRNNSILTIGDNQGKLHEIAVEEIDEVIRQDVSTMPVGLEQRITQQELLDLIEFLTQQKN
jgi:putative heme-binding domain-containing protein